MLRIRIIAVIGLIAISGGWALPVQAAEYHEDPAAAKTIYSGLSLLLYYSDSLDPVLQTDPAETEKVLSIMPLANIPRELENATRSFTVSGIDLAGSLAKLLTLWQEENRLVNQYRLEEANTLGKQVASGFPTAQGQLAQLKAAVEATGAYLKVDTTSSPGEIKTAFNQVMDKINRLEQMLELLHRSLELSGLLNESIKPVLLSLAVSPLEAYVGDEIEFTGALSSEGEALPGREVEILLNNTIYLMLRTDAAGRYHGRLEIPEWYIPQITVQAVYFPRGDDIGLYLGSSSAVIRLTVRYYQAGLTIRAEGPGYPGRELGISGSFDYGKASPIDREGSELYFDNQPVKRFKAAGNFKQMISLDPATEIGKHALTLSVPAEGRYAPVHSTCVVEVTQAATLLDLKSPSIGFIPGNFEFSGRVYSEFGPIPGTPVNIIVDQSRKQITAAPDGSVTAQIHMPFNFSLLGSQSITIEVQPSEPWNAPLTVTRNIFLINIVSCVILLVVLVFLAFYLPRKFRRSFGAYPAKATGRAGTLNQSLVPARVERQAAKKESEGNGGKVQDPVFEGYRLVLRLVQKATRAALKPQQTLREYAQENSRVLGPLSQYFLEFTVLIEKILYSTHKPDDEDIERSRQLSQTISEESKGENL
jgi:hypothetical protein